MATTPSISSSVCHTAAHISRTAPTTPSVLFSLRQRSDPRSTSTRTTSIHCSTTWLWWRTWLWTRRTWPWTARTRTQQGGSRLPAASPCLLPNQQAARQPAAQSSGGIPPPAGGDGGRGGGRGGTATNPYKRWNNWNACFSCGCDVPGWHYSKTCPGPRRDGHQEGYERGNSKQYIDAGHQPSMRGEHKKHLPIPGTQWGE